MYKINGEDIDIYVVIRGYISRDVILRNYTQDKVKCLGCFKNYHKAVERCNEIKRILEFSGAEKLLTHQHEDKGEK